MILRCLSLTTAWKTFPENQGKSIFTSSSVFVNGQSSSICMNNIMFLVFLFFSKYLEYFRPWSVDSLKFREWQVFHQTSRLIGEVKKSANPNLFIIPNNWSRPVGRKKSFLTEQNCPYYFCLLHRPFKTIYCFACSKHNKAEVDKQKKRERLTLKKKNKHNDKKGHDKENEVPVFTPEIQMQTTGRRYILRNTCKKKQVEFYFIPLLVGN